MEESGSVTGDSATSNRSLFGSVLDWISVVASSAVTSSSLSHRGVVPQPPVEMSDSGRACAPPWAARPLLDESIESARKSPNTAADTSASAIKIDGRSARPHVSWMRGRNRPIRLATCVMFARMSGNQPTLCCHAHAASHVRPALRSQPANVRRGYAHVLRRTGT